MTTNNPPIAAWAPGAALAKLASRHNNAPCVLTDGPAELNDVALVRLDDYEAFQAECKELRTALAESRANDLTAMGYLNQIRGMVGAADLPDMVRRCEKLRAECEKLRSIISDLKDWDCDVSGGFLSIPVDLRRRMQEAIDAAIQGGQL